MHLNPKTTILVSLILIISTFALFKTIHSPNIFIFEKLMNTNIKKKKIIILSSTGGSCHTSATKKLTELLENDYEIKVTHPIKHIMNTGEQLYDKLLQNGWIRLLNFTTYYVAPFYVLNVLNKKVQKKLVEYFEKEKPDLVISVIPYINPVTYNSTIKYNAKCPYLLITLDPELTMWTFGFNKIKNPNFTMTVINDYLKKTFSKQIKKIPEENIKTVGMPIRKDFFVEKTTVDKTNIKKEWNIPENKFTVMIMMGGAGSNAILKYARNIIKNDLPIHVLACIGKKADLEKKLLSLINKNKTQTTFTIVPFTNKIPELMEVSDVLITKPSPGTTHEAITKKLPIIVDETIKILFWEKGTLDFIKRYNIGTSIKKMRHLKGIIEQYQDKDFYNKCLKNFNTLPKNDFDTKIKDIVHNLCPQKSL